MKKLNIGNDIILRVVLPLIIGGIIYMIYRSEKLILFEWCTRIGFNEVISFLRQNFSFQLPEWIKFNLPDALWLFSFTSLLIIIWKREVNKGSLFFILLPLFISFCWEFGQYAEIINGTFDIKDLLFYTIATLFAFQNIKKYNLLLIIKKI
jgi:hypothetical protein